ncbi:MAG: carbamate kinase [Beijerinckiaceae bacterium]|nr:carbamate kinase [Beijerinckiaceae bacterium]
MRIVVALGGNALSKRGKPMTAELQRGNARKAATALIELIKAGHQIVITHGNGPQVGMLGLQAQAGPSDGNYPLDVLGAESEGLIGYIIEQELRNVLPPHALLTTLLTQTLVDAADVAFLHPTKPVGPIYDEPTARKFEKERGWTIAKDGDHWRRVVASPRPKEIIQMNIIEMLVGRNVTVICAGGGGVPVVRDTYGVLTGMEAVIDKDLASALVARRLGADMLLLLTDVDAVYQDFGQPAAKRIASIGAQALDADQFAAGSMRPKLEAAEIFTTATGRPAAIGRLEDALAVATGEAGTVIVAGQSALNLRNDPL